MEIERSQKLLMRIVNEVDVERMRFEKDLQRSVTTIETLRDMVEKLSKQYRKAVQSLEQECKNSLRQTYIAFSNSY